MTQRFFLTPDYSISRVIKGGWHLAGGHGSIDREQAVKDMATFVEAGMTTFDMADIYTGVEELVGEFRRRYPSHAKQIQIHTKCVPDLSLLASLQAKDLEVTIDRSLQRLGVERLDLVQFHWWDYGIPGYLEALSALDRLRQAGKIRFLGLTNFDTAHVQEICEAGIPILTHQVQYSLLDARPERSMIHLCERNGIHLLCYGTVAGGFLSEKWLDQSEPMLETLTNRSLIKYKLIIEDFGGWDLFQHLLHLVSDLAREHQISIASVASAYVLVRPRVAGVIVGATNTNHLLDNASLTSLRLSDREQRMIQQLLLSRQGPSGDCYTLERDREGKHGRIMRYNLQNK